MKDKVMPLIFLNLCGEMLYVILQRLDAQNISPEKTSKVIQDIISTMLNDQFLEELFKPQKMYTRLAMQSVFEKLIHSSIMRLNSNSMSKIILSPDCIFPSFSNRLRFQVVSSKIVSRNSLSTSVDNLVILKDVQLYDLMLMVFKYQVVNCQQPEDILLVTLNHMDAIKNCSKPYPELLNKVKGLYSLVISNYSELSHNDYECLYKSIDVFLENLNVRVSVLMKLGLQLPNGEIVIAKNDQLHSLSSECEENEYQRSISPTRLDFEGERNFILGTNIYIQSAVSETPRCDSEPLSQHFASANETSNDKKDFKEVELSLLTRLIGKCTPSSSIPEIILASPNEEEKCDQLDNDENRNSCSFVNIDASQVSKQNLEKICKELVVNVEEKPKFDILDLLDTVETSSM